MPEEYDLGKLVASIALDSKDLEEGAVNSVNALDNIRIILKDLGVDSKKTEEILKKNFSDTSQVESYLLKMEAVSQKIEDHQKELQELQKQEKEARKLWDELNQSAGKSNNPYISQYASQIEAVNQKLQTQENRYDQIQLSLDNYVKKAVTDYDKLIQKEETAVQKQQLLNDKILNAQARADLMQGFTLATNSLRNINGISSNTINNLTTIIFNVNALKQAMQSGTSVGMKWAQGISAVAGIAVTAVTSLVEHFAEEEEEQAQKVKDYYEALDERTGQYTKSLKELLSQQDETFAKAQGEAQIVNTLKEEYDELREKTSLTTVEKERLADVADELAGKLNVTTDELKEQSGTYRDITGDIENYTEKMINAAKAEYFAKVIKESAAAMEELKKPIEEAENELEEFRDANKEVAAESQKIAKMQETSPEGVYIEVSEEVQAYRDRLHELKVELAGYKDEFNTAQETMNNAIDEYKALTVETSNNTGAVIDQNKIYAAAESRLESLSSKTKTYESKVSSLKGSLSSLSSCYDKLNQGQTLDCNTILDLIDKYPEYASQLAGAAGNADLQKKAIEALFEAKKKEYILTQQTAIDNIDASNEETETVIENTKKQIKAKKELIEALTISDFKQNVERRNELRNDIAILEEKIKNLQEQITTNNSQRQGLQERINIAEDLDINSFSTSGNSGSSSSKSGKSESDNRTKYTTTVGYSWKGESYNASYDFYEGDDTSTLEADTRAKALLGLLDRVKSMGKVTAQEEISYLNDVLKTANLSADQQYEIRQRLYNAQKSFAESEKKAQEDALKAEYDRIEKSKNRGEISTKEEIEQLENIKKKFALTTEQKIALEEKLYDKRKQLREEEQKAQEEAIKAEYARIEKSRSRGEISTKQEIEQLEKIYKKYKLTTEQKAELDDKLYEKRKQLQEENLKAEYEQIEKKKSRNEISTKEEIAQLEKIYRKYKLTTEQKEELDEKLYEKRQQLRSEEISALDKLGDAVVTALKSKYAQQKELEEKRLDESVESWQKWEDETVNSIQGQIDALDELKEAHEEENKREEYENKRQALELELRYEKDDYNRKQIQKEIAALDKEENERLFSVQIEERKKALQEQQEEAKELSKAKQEEIQNTKAEMSARYDELMTDFALQGEAKKFILESSQDEITQLINSYASDYEMLGTTLGESLYNGISKKVGDIVEYVDDIAKKTDTQAERDKAAKALEKYVSSGAAQGSVKEPAVIPAANKVISFADSFSDILRRISESASLYKQQMSSVADSSAMHFYQTQRNYSTNSSTNSTRNSKTINVNTTVNFQRQVDSPAQMKRRLEGILVDVAKQM